jgi:putative ATP-dependent endonuclease of OLD family
MELSLAGADGPMTRGLGVHNILFIAAELLALDPGNEPDLPLVLIEEPEAHLHPQLQLRLVEYIRSQSKTAPSSPGTQIQAVLTTHSPNLASKVGLKNIIFMNKGRAYRMGPEVTKLDTSDYAFLERFLDVTKANLFFATGVLVVVGDAEALLLPAIADILKRPLTEYGVSIVNVGHVGLFRYSRIFQRADAEVMPVKVACLADRDIPPQEAKPLLPVKRKTEEMYTKEQIDKKLAALKKNDGGSVQTFVSPTWTLEYDLARTPMAPHVHGAISLAVVAKQQGSQPPEPERTTILANASSEYDAWVAEGKSADDIACIIYEPLLAERASKPEAAQCLARLLPTITVIDVAAILPRYLVDAIKFVTGGENGGAPQPAPAAGI